MVYFPWNKPTSSWVIPPWRAGNLHLFCEFSFLATPPGGRRSRPMCESPAAQSITFPRTRRNPSVERKVVERQQSSSLSCLDVLGGSDVVSVIYLYLLFVWILRPLWSEGDRPQTMRVGAASAGKKKSSIHLFTCTSFALSGQEGLVPTVAAYSWVWLRPTSPTNG